MISVWHFNAKATSQTILCNWATIEKVEKSFVPLKTKTITGLDHLRSEIQHIILLEENLRSKTLFPHPIELPQWNLEGRGWGRCVWSQGPKEHHGILSSGSCSGNLISTVCPAVPLKTGGGGFIGIFCRVNLAEFLDPLGGECLGTSCSQPVWGAGQHIIRHQEKQKPLGILLLIHATEQSLQALILNPTVL